MWQAHAYACACVFTCARIILKHASGKFSEAKWHVNTHAYTAFKP
jgi:hypothetical protein